MHCILISQGKNKLKRNMSDDNKNEEEPKYTLFQKEEESELIRNIKEKAEELKENAEEVLENTKESVSGTVTEGQDCMERVMANMKEMVRGVEENFFQGDRAKMVACMVGVVMMAAIILGTMIYLIFFSGCMNEDKDCMERVMANMKEMVRGVEENYFQGDRAKMVACMVGVVLMAAIILVTTLYLFFFSGNIKKDQNRMERVKDNMDVMVQDVQEIYFQGDRSRMVACMVGVVLVVAIILGMAVASTILD